MANPVPAGSDVSAGTYTCTNCGYELGVGSTEHLPPCPKCGNGDWNTVTGGDAAADPYPRQLTREENTMGKTARDVMTSGAECIGESDTIADAAKRLAELDVGAMPICGEDNRLKGMLSDRDIVVKVIAQGKDVNTTKAGELGEGKPVTIGADDSVDDALHTMAEHKVRRLPVIDGHDLIGIVSQADLAKNVDEEKVGDLVEAISAAP